nr:N-terminal acetyltransferase B complex catalytic subunit NAA20 [Tanacetum cinerariifolium]
MCDTARICLATFMGRVEGQSESWHGHVTAFTLAPELHNQQLGKKLVNFLEDINDKIARMTSIWKTSAISFIGFGFV